MERVSQEHRQALISMTVFKGTVEKDDVAMTAAAVLP
jgi:hypothetical protein